MGTLFSYNAMSPRKTLTAATAAQFNNLYIAAKVNDNIIAQDYTSKDMYKGDHVMVRLSTAGSDPKALVYVIGLSPGNFNNNLPSATIFAPENISANGINVGAVKTTDGYQIEASIPWKIFGDFSPQTGRTLGLDIYISDSDANTQELMMNVSGNEMKKVCSADNLLSFVLGDSNGAIDPALIKNYSTIKVIELTKIKTNSSQVFAIENKTVVNMKELLVRGLLERVNGYAGGCFAMKLEFNGKPLDDSRILLRTANQSFPRNDFVAFSPSRGWFLLYHNDFGGADTPKNYSDGVEINPFEFHFDVSDLIKSTDNSLKIYHTNSLVENPLLIDASMSPVLSPKAQILTLKNAPIGEIPRIEPIAKLKVPLYVANINEDGSINVGLNQQNWVVESEYSTLTPAWAKLGNGRNKNKEWLNFVVTNDTLDAITKSFEVKRKIIKHPTHIQVIDTLSNLTDKDLPLMYKHSFDAHSNVKDFYVAGNKIDGKVDQREVGAFPVALAMYENTGLGIVGEDDYSRAQGVNYVRDNRVGAGNQRFVLPPKVSREVEFSLYPLEKADTFLLVNRIRDTWKNNFTIDGPGFMMSQKYINSKLKDDKNLEDYIDFKGGKFMILGLMCMYNKVNLDGLTYPLFIPAGADMPRYGFGENWKEDMARVKQLRPNMKFLVYFHAFITTGEENRKKFAADALITMNGLHADYGGGWSPQYVPREGSAYAQVNDELLQWRFDMGVDGLFWDEFERSSHTYDYNPNYWDNCTAIISPTTHQIVRKISNVPLAVLSWRIKVLDRIFAEKKLLIANGGPILRSTNNYKFPRFVETQSSAFLLGNQLYTPLALGDSHSEKTDFDAYKNMLKYLDYGALYYCWYGSSLHLSRKNFANTMFPVTPIDLGYGYMIAQERIITKVSGLFGWGDNSTFRAYVFDRMGKITSAIQIPLKNIEGKNYAEVRIPEGYGVTLERQKP